MPKNEFGISYRHGGEEYYAIDIDRISKFYSNKRTCTISISPRVKDIEQIPPSLQILVVDILVVDILRNLNDGVLQIYGKSSPNTK